MAQPVHESHWNHHKDTLKRVRSQLDDERRRPKAVTRGFQPLNDTHPLLTGSRNVRSPPKSPPRGRHSRTPPSHLPRLQTPPEHKHESRVRGVKFGILPKVSRHHNDGDDSWGEEEESDEEGYPQYPQLPYAYPGSKLPMPVVMYPMILPPQPAPRKSKGKKVRMRNSPIFLNSRDNTLHEPHFVHSTQRHEDRYRYPYDGGGGYSLDDQAFSYITPHQQQSYDPFDPSMNPVLARYTADFDRRRSPVSQGKYLREAQKYQRRESPLVRHSDPPERFSSYGNDAVLEKCAEDLLNDALDENMRDVVNESLDSYVTEYMHKAAIYDVAVDIVTEVIEDFDGPDIASDALAEVFFEDFIQAEIINPEVEEQSHDVITEVCNDYNNKRRRRDIRQVKHDSGDKMMDSLCLDYLLLLSARQGRIWTENEHFNKLYDGMVTSLLLEQLVGVEEERRNDIQNKPVRRHHEKMITDVAVDVLLGELCPSLDEDMADLDEYEMGMESRHQAKYAELEKVLQGL